jgi:hypothetical protein
MDIFKILLLIVLIYAVALSVLFYNEKMQKELFMKNKVEQLAMKESELTKRESLVVDKELCFRELTKIKTIHTTIQDIVNAYKLPDTNSAPSQLSTDSALSLASPSPTLN